MKGPSTLSIVPKFDLVRGVAMDYMHCVLLGVTRLLLRLWFDSSHHREPWYIGKCVAKVDTELCAIRPTNEIPRTPRSIQATVKYWKGINMLTNYALSCTAWASFLLCSFDSKPSPIYCVCIVQCIQIGGFVRQKSI